jgi:hypothetical protein
MAEHNSRLKVVAKDGSSPKQKTIEIQLKETQHAEETKGKRENGGRPDTYKQWRVRKLTVLIDHQCQKHALNTKHFC